MKFYIQNGDWDKKEADLLASFAFDVKHHPSLSSFALPVLDREKFEDKEGSTILLREGSARLLVLGIGDLKKCTMATLQNVSADISRSAKKIRAKTVTVLVPLSSISKQTTRSASQIMKGMVEGMMLGSYAFLKHKDKEEQKKESDIERVTFIVDGVVGKELEQAIHLGTISGEAVSFTRDLVNEPASVTTPTFLSLTAQSIAKEHSSMDCAVFGKEDIEKLGMGGLLGISKGSAEEPKFIRLSYTAKHAKKTVVLCGKGITFDSGGLSLKPDKAMETMKIDMAGAAAVLGICSSLAKTKPDVHVIGLIAACENMPSGGAIKPGDIVSAMNGKTIEIINTDAEGRVILADTLSYAVLREKPDVMIDIATLTGACMVALGEHVAGLFSSDKRLADALRSSAENTGESLWELPLVSQYRELLKGRVGDIKNTSASKYGGAITAALFLQEFVPDSVSWAHVDIAGPAFEEKGTALTPYGGTGFAVRLILDYLSRNF